MTGDRYDIYLKERSNSYMIWKRILDLLETAVMYIILNQDLVHTKFFGGRYTLDKDEIVDWLNEEVPESGKVWISKRRELRYEFTGAYEPVPLNKRYLIQNTILYLIIVNFGHRLLKSKKFLERELRSAYSFSKIKKIFPENIPPQ